MHEESVRIMSILMPYALRQMQEAYQSAPGQTHARFVHYTSAEAALKIIQTKRFWMRNTNCMADYREVQHGFDIYKNYFQNEANRKAFDEAFDACSAGLAKEALASFDNWWNDLRFNTYISSVSKHSDDEDMHGRLSMWRAFGGGTRVAIVLRIPYVSGAANALALSFSPVAYLSAAKAHEGMDQVIANVRANRDYLSTLPREALVRLVHHMLSAGIVCLKHEGFHEEREWRAMYTPTRWSSPLIETSTEVIAGAPQLIHKIPLDGSVSPLVADVDLGQVFDRLIVGPTQYAYPICRALAEALAAAGIADAHARVWFSEILLAVGLGIWLGRRMMPSQMKPTSIGDTEMQRRFIEAHGLFIQEFRNIEALKNRIIDLVIERYNKTLSPGSEPLSHDTPEFVSRLADIVLYSLLKAAFEDFGELLILAGNGLGFGATKALRSLYERAVMSAFLGNTPAEAVRFVEQDALDLHKL
jgi:hypothetical protein